MRIALSLVFLFFGLGNVFAQQPSDQCSSARQAQGALVGAFRVLNTAEMSYSQTNHKFATVSELASTDELKKLWANKSYSQPVEGSVEIASAEDPLPGYTVHSIVQVLLHHSHEERWPLQECWSRYGRARIDLFH